jgi:hypothetical protein
MKIPTVRSEPGSRYLACFVLLAVPTSIDESTVQCMTILLLTEGDVARGHAPNIAASHRICGVVDRTGDAVCTRRLMAMVDIRGIGEYG